MSTWAPPPAGVGPTWRALFPFLESTFNRSDAERVGAASSEQIASITQMVAEAAVYEHCDTALAVLMPGLAQIEEIPWNVLGTRARNALVRGGIETLPQLLGWSVRDLLDVPGLGAGTTVTMLEVLARCSVDRAQRLFAVPASPHAGSDDALAPLEFVEVWDSGGEVDANYRLDLVDQALGSVARVAELARLTDDLMTLARWHALRGTRTTPLFSEEGLQEAPQHVRLARERLTGATAENLVDDSSQRPSVILEMAMASLTAREKDVLRLRTFADDPVTLDALAQPLGLSRERVRQIEMQAEHSLTDTVMDGALGDLAAAVRSRIGLVCRLQHLLDVFPALSESVPSIDRPAWRVLDRLDSTFEIEDGWAAVPGLREAREITRSVVAACANPLGVAELNQVAQRLGFTGNGRREELQAWAESCGCVFFEDHISPRQLSISEWALLILHGTGTPLSVEELSKRIPVDRAASSIRNALADDERFVRADRDTFALAAWGGAAYAGIRDAIGRAIDAGGGAVDLAWLVRELTTQFTVAESSVRTYAQAHPFVTVEGKVRRRETIAVPAANPSGTRRLYRLSDGWALRLQVTADHARGSGSVLPTALAVLLGLFPGHSATISCRGGDQSVSWTGLQPSLGSIRRLLEPGGLTVGDWMCAVFDDSGSFSLAPVHADGQTGVALALTLAGIPEADVPDPRETLAGALSLPLNSSWSSIIAAARNRGDDDLAEALIADPTVDTAAASHIARSSLPASDSTVEEILDLL